jgi:DNA primase
MPPGAFNDDKERVLAATDIVRLIGEQVSLRKKGREFVGLCPFHDDHSPSMYVVPHKQIYKCFSCGAAGDPIRFVMDHHKLSFREALEYLADRAGITLTPFKPRSVAPNGDDPRSDAPLAARATKEELANANATAQAFFRAIYDHSEHGSSARAIADKRALTTETIARFGIGATPDKWDGLVLTLEKRGLPVDAFVAAGLLKRRESGAGVYDAFRNRLMFPIHDQLGRVVAFGGRRLNDADEPKYINSPETTLFNKSATLYALNLAADSIKRSGVAIVTEGYMDAIACHQAGVTNVVATLGTALTPIGARVLQRLCSKIVLFFDGDEAGQKAADRAIEVFFGAGLDVRIATLSAVRERGLTSAKDPDELLKQQGEGDRAGRAVFDQVIAQAQDALAYRFARLSSRTRSLGLSAKATAVQEEVERLAELGLKEIVPIRQQMIVRQIARIAGVDEATIWTAVRASRAMRPAPVAAQQNPGATASGSGTPGASSTASANAIDTSSTAIMRSAAGLAVAIALTEPGVLSALTEPQALVLERSSQASQSAASLARHLIRLWRERGTGLTFADIRAEIDDSPEGQAVSTLAVSLAADVEARFSDRLADMRTAFEACVLDICRQDATRAALADAQNPEPHAASVEHSPGKSAPVAGESGGTRGPVLDPNLAAAERLARLREVERTVGRDPRTMPRPWKSG